MSIINTFKINKYRLLLIMVAVLIGTSVVFAIVNYESPEDCFVRELKEWGEREGLTDKLSGSSDKSDSRLSVAKAKTLLSEYNVKDLTGDTKKIYLRFDTLIEYCEVE